MLSGFFFMLTLLTYAEYAQGKAEGRNPKSKAQGSGLPVRHALFPLRFSLSYTLSFFFFACGLMSKPMLVTLPCVLLLLDFWPLRRFELNSKPPILKTLLPLILEKLPFFALAAASSVVTFLVQQRAGAVASADALSLELRLENAVVSYLLYLSKTVWPARLAIFYPYRFELSGELVAISIFVLVVISLLSWVTLRRRPYVAVGWLWFLGTLVPVLGIVQVGQQAMADRYTYIPLTGLFISFTWAVADLLRWRPANMTDSTIPNIAGAGGAAPFKPPWYRRFGLVGVALAAVGACLALTSGQVRHWQNSETLFRHTLAVTTDNAFAHASLGDELTKQGRMEEAEAHFAEAVRLRPRYPEALSDLGLTRVMRGKLEEGIEYYRAAIVINPRYWKAHDNLARALCQQGKFDEAVKEYQTTLEMEPGAIDTRGFLAAALVGLGKTNEARTVFEDALKLKPQRCARGSNTPACYGH
ncbi:MAG: tetratricopeptide repeat protein [Verrucomicrobia bacterium]|nr:tetratricopeptide repeat protein [Verrucomicrobiota bacterium]